ncbi:MAG: HEAT repeat domain-containing protein [Promethearchaeota archaeon]
MERDLKGLIDSIDEKDKTEAVLERKIESLQEEINRLKFTIREQKLLIQSLKEDKNESDEIILDDDIQLLKEMIFSQRQEILKKDEQIHKLKENLDGIGNIGSIPGKSNQYMEEINNLNEKIKVLNQQLEIFKSNEENAKRLIQELTEQEELSKNELEELQKYIQNLDSEKSDDVALKENENRNKEYEDLQSEIADYQLQVIDLQQSLQSLENASKQEREKSNYEISQLKLESERYQEEIIELKDKFQNIEKSELKEGLIENIDEYVELEKHYENQMARLESENKAYEAELESLRTQIRNIQSSEQKNKNEQQELYDIDSTEIVQALKNENETLKESLFQLKKEKVELDDKILKLEENYIENMKMSDDDEVSSIIRELKAENQDLIIENRELKTKLSIKLSDEAELKQIIEKLKVKNHKLKTQLEVEILEKEYEIPKESESQLYKDFLNNLDQKNMQYVIDNLIRDIKGNTSYDVKKSSLSLLATINDVKVKNLFSKLIMDKDWLIRYHLIKAIGKTRNIEYKDLLIKLSKDRDVDVREAAIDALSKL